MSEVIDFRNPNNVTQVEPPKDEFPEPFGKEFMITQLECLLEDVKANRVDAVFCCWTFNKSPGASMGFRGGDQGITLLGRIEHLKSRLASELSE